MRCGRCRAEVMLGSAQCHRCGANMLTGALDAPPPPPPPPPPGTAPPRQRRRQQATPTPNPAARGCGCALPVVLVLVAVLGVGAAAIVRVVNDAAGNDSGDVQFEGRITPGVVGEGGIGSGEADRWELVDVGTGPHVLTVDGHDGFDPQVEVLAAGASLGSNDDADGSRDSRLRLDLQAGTTYEVLVTGFGDSSGDYDLEVVSAVVEHGALQRGDALFSRLDADQTARYRIAGEGLPVRIAVHGDDGFDAVLRVVAADGTVLAEDDDTEGRDPVLDAVVLPGGQQSVVEVREFNGRAGSYTVEVT